MKKLLTPLLLFMIFSPAHAFGATLLDDNFDSLTSIQDIANHVNGWDSVAYDPSPMTLETSGCHSGKCVKMTWDRSWTWWGLGLDVDAPIIHTSFWFKYGGNTSYHSKFLKVFSTDNADSSHYANLTVNNGYNGWGMGAVIGEAHSSLGQGGFAARFDGLYPEWVDGDIVRNTGDMRGTTEWQHFEIVMKKNTAGNKDGYVKIWLNATNEEDYCFSLINLNFLPDNNPLNFDYISFANYAPSNADGTAPMENWYDDVIVTDTTTYIGSSGTYIPPTTHTLSVSKLGTGAGTVTSNTGVIDCGVKCSGDVEENSSTVLTFTPDLGSVITSVTGCTLSGNQCTVAMGTNNEAVTATFDTSSGAAVFDWSAATYSVGEDDGTAIVGRINRSVDTSGTASVYWQTFGITADGADDYMGVYPTLVEFADGESYKDVSLVILSDELVEDDETAELRLSSPVNGTLGSQYSSVLTIADADSAIINTRSDVDGSSQINTTDALLTLRNSLGLSMNGTAWQASATTGDVNCDGNANSTDALLILRYSLGLSMSETEWCEGSDY